MVRLLVDVLDAYKVPDDADIVKKGCMYPIYFKVEEVVSTGENLDEDDLLDDEEAQGEDHEMQDAELNNTTNSGHEKSGQPSMEINGGAPNNVTTQEELALVEEAIDLAVDRLLEELSLKVAMEHDDATEEVIPRGDMPSGGSGTEPGDNNPLSAGEKPLDGADGSQLPAEATLASVITTPKHAVIHVARSVTGEIARTPMEVPTPPAAAADELSAKLDGVKANDKLHLDGKEVLREPDMTQLEAPSSEVMQQLVVAPDEELQLAAAPTDMLREEHAYDRDAARGSKCEAACCVD